MAAQKPGPPIDYQKVFTERVTIRLSAPAEPELQATGSELIHGYLCDIHRLKARSEELKNTIEILCRKWNIFYVE